MNRFRWACFGILVLELGCSPSQGSSPGAETPPASRPAAAAVPASSTVDPGYIGEDLPVELKTPLAARVEFVGKHDELRVVSLILPDDYSELAVRDLKLAAHAGEYKHFYVDAPAARVAFGLANDLDSTHQLLAPGAQEAGSDGSNHRIWLLLDEQAVSRLAVSIYFTVGDKAVKARVSIPALPPAETPGTEIWAASLVRYFQSSLRGERTSFSTFADARLREQWFKEGELQAPRNPVNDSWEAESELARWMYLGTGYASIEAALQHRTTSGSGILGKPTRPIKEISAPTLRHHDWPLMLKQLGRAPVTPPLSRLTPASFYYVSAKDGESLFTVLDEFDDWGTAALRFIEHTGTRANMLERYMSQLGLSRSGFSRLLGPQAMAEVAWIGSDPYLRRGSDVTLIIRPKNRALLQAGLETVLISATESLKDVTAQELQLSGETVRSWSTPDKKLQRFQAELNGMVVLSNSAEAMTLVLQTAQGKLPPLSAEADFQYMLARDETFENGPPDVLGYLGDAFIGRTVSPQSRILDARRGVAWSELRRVGNAALLGGYFGGDLRPTAETLIKAQVLKKEELVHFDASAITMSGTRAPFSNWGTAAHLRPLLELPELQLVSEQEAHAYEQFRSSYEAEWGDVMDPIAVRLWVSKDKKQVNAKVRVLPVARSGEYGSLLSFAGAERVKPGEGPAGVRFILAIGEDSMLRREGNGLSSTFLNNPSFLDWVGEYAYVGLADQPAIAEALRPSLAPHHEPSQLPELDGAEAALQMPFYASLAIKSRAAASLALAFLHEKFLRDESSLEHLTLKPYRKLPVWKLSYSDGADRYSIFYSLGERALFFSLKEDVLRDLLDREAKGLEPKSSGTAGGNSQRRGAGGRAFGPQDTLDQVQFQAALQVLKGGGLYTALAWLLDYEPMESPSFQLASEVYGAWGNRDAPVTQAFYDYCGEEPVTQDGRRFEWSASGVLDPARGGEFVYRWPRLPDPESHIGKILNSISKISTSLGVEQEAPGQETEQQSLSIELDVTKR